MTTPYIKFKYLPLVAAAVLLLYSCQKVIDLKLSNAAAQLVIEGNLTNLRGRQVVKISQSVPFTNTNVFPAVSGALVSISDKAGNTFKFTEDTAGIYSYPILRGIAGNTYTLTVQINGKTYTAVSTMPQPVKLDSVNENGDTFDKNKRNITVNYLDPAGAANQYRFVMYINGVIVNNIFANDDNFTDGRYVHEELFENTKDIHPGDHVTIEMQCIDPIIFTYWYSLRLQQGNNPGGGTAPSNPPSNFNNNALGYFSAHTSQSISLVAK